MTGPREIVLINRHEGGQPSFVDKLEKLSKIASAVALPLVVGVGGWWIQDALSRRTTDQDYVELAISILSKPHDETQSELREWAASLLDETSPIEIPHGLREKLSGGEVQLPPRVLRGFAPVSELADTDRRSDIISSIARFDARRGGSKTVCTAWLISAYQILTAGHCAPSGGNGIEAATALFDYRNPISSDDTSSVDLVLPAAEINSSLDFAVFGFEQDRSLIGVPLTISPSAPAVGGKLYILHYPQGQELSFSVQPCRVLSVDEKHIAHDCETSAGSAGAPLINADTLEVIGIHLGKDADMTNFGVRMDAIIASSRSLATLSNLVK